MKPLPIPQAVARDPSAREILRVWSMSERQVITLDHHAWDDPAAWGLMLMDLARHIANAYASEGTRSKVEALHRVLEGFDVERNNPTDDAEAISD